MRLGYISTATDVVVHHSGCDGWDRQVAGLFPAQTDGKPVQPS
jgi:hypothetical protein